MTQIDPILTKADAALQSALSGTRPVSAIFKLYPDLRTDMNSVPRAQAAFDLIVQDAQTATGQAPDSLRSMPQLGVFTVTASASFIRAVCAHPKVARAELERTVGLG